VPRVLVADDNSNIQKMVALALEDQGISVVAVGNGEAAVRKLGEAQPDVVLADVFMPVRNGYEVCEFVKKDPRFAHIPVVLLIGAFDPFDENEARRVGANGVLKKPFVPPDPLIAMVTGFVTGQEKRPATPSPAVHEEEHALEPPVASTAPGSETDAEPETESAPEEFTVGRGPLSLREEDHEVQEPAAPPISELPSEERWEERLANWRREAIGYEIPSDVAEPSPEFSASETTSPAFIPEESSIVEEITPEKPPDVSVGVGPDPALMRNPAEWLEMMSPSTQEPLPEPQPSPAPPPSLEVEGRRSIFHPERIVPQQPPASGLAETSSDSESVIPFPARAEAQPETLHEHAESEPQPETPETFYGHAESEPQPETLPEQRAVEATGESATFEPQPAPELFGFIQASSYAGDATQTEHHPAFEAEEHSYAPPQEPDSAGSHVESYSAPPSLDPALVDAVVTKVLARIEPQLRDILTRELLRPLAESLLERELQKK
jgi:CheY-like chemotaxis protein